MDLEIKGLLILTVTYLGGDGSGGGGGGRKLNGVIPILRDSIYYKVLVIVPWL